MQIKLDLKKLAKQVASIDVISKERGWEYQYDSELDSLYFSPKKVGSKFTLFSVSDEFSVFVDSKSNLGGVFIEYYKSNLSSHEVKFKPFKTMFTTHKKNAQIKEKEVLLSEVLKAEILSELVNRESSTLSIPA